MRSQRTVHGLDHARVVDRKVCPRPMPTDGQSIVGRLPGAPGISGKSTSDNGVYGESATTAGVRGYCTGSGSGVTGASVGGAGGSFLANGTRGAVNIGSGTPSAPQNGDIWYDTTSGALKVCVGGVVKTITTA